MPDLSTDQIEKRASIQKSATIFGVIVGVIAGALALWVLGGYGAALRFGGAIVIAAALGFLVYRASFKSGAKSALCEKCAAAFSRSRTDHVETLKSSKPGEKLEEQPDKSTKVTTWTEDTFDVLDTYTCAKCADVTTKAYQTTRRRDEKSVIRPVEPPTAKQSQKGAAAATKSGKSGSASKGRSGGRRG